jgi:hypothetical protein
MFDPNQRCHHARRTREKPGRNDRAFCWILDCYLLLRIVPILISDPLLKRKPPARWKARNHSIPGG